jgi:hypothetical protein
VHIEVHHVGASLGEFRQCYWDALAAEIERRRAQGLPVPEGINGRPVVDVEVADD